MKDLINNFQTAVRWCEIGISQMGLDAWEPVFDDLHLRSLISAFVISLLESAISKLATSEKSLLYLVSVAEQASLRMTWSETPKTGFLTCQGPNKTDN